MNNMSKRIDKKFEDYQVKLVKQNAFAKKCEQLISALESATDFVSFNKAYLKWNKYMEEVGTDTAVVSVKYTLNTQNPTYKKLQDQLDELSPIMSNYSNRVAKIITSSQFRPELEKKYGSYLLKMYDATLTVFDQKIIPELIKENKLTSEYEALIGSAEINFRGEVLNLSQLGKYTQDVDRQTRKEAAMAMDKWIGEHEEQFARIYDELVHLRDEMAKKLGYKNYIELGYKSLGRLDYDAKDVEKYRKQIAECVVPECNKLYKRQMKELGIKNPQNYDYALQFKNGNPVPAGDEQYLVEAARVMYTDLGTESQEFFDYMQRNHLMDLTARKGKTAGGYCTFFSKYKAPFIFSNFNGTDGDVNVLTHEGGHAFQAFLSSDIKVPEYRSPTLEACEIHSMSMEFFAWKYMDKFFQKDAEKYKYLHLADAIKFLPYGITVDEFQHWVYENPNATHEERCAYWRSLEQKYTPHKKYDDLPTYNHGAYWVRQSHIFSTPFYYIDYTLAQVVAFQFFIEMNKNRDKAWKKYVKLCKFGGKAPFVELLEKNHLRNPFIDGNVKKVIKPLMKILNDFDTSNF